MPSREHNALVEMFRHTPSLAPHVLSAVLRVRVPDHLSATVVEASLDQLIPTEYRADLVIDLEDERGKLVLSIVVEVQLREDPDKHFSWPVYVTTSRARKRCPVCVLVVTSDPDVAAWAREPIMLGVDPEDGFVRPRVLGPSDVPRVVDPEVASREPHLTVLAAIAHGNSPDGPAVLRAALAALAAFDAKSAEVYLQVIYDALRASARRALEELMETMPKEEREIAPPIRRFFARLKAEGLAEGKAEGLAEGKAEGKAEGEAQGMRRALLKVIARAGIALSPEELARIEACADLAVLDRWLDNAASAKAAADLFA